MKAETVLILNWVSFLIHCSVLALLIISFSLPHWYVGEAGVDGKEVAGLWVRCKEGGACRPVEETTDPMLVNITPVQALMTVSLILCVISFGLYSVWLWKGEGCNTPWRKRCVWCRETYIRSKKPTEEETIKYGQLKWLAFALSTVAGVLIISGSVFFMTDLMTIDGLTPANIGWAAWMALSSAVLLLFQHGVISLFFYALKRPDLRQLPAADRTPDGDDPYASREVDDHELEHIRKWIMDQRRGADNASFESDCQTSAARLGPHGARSARSRASSPSIYYSGQSTASSTSGSVYRPPRLIDPKYLRSLRSHRPDKLAQYVPAYSVIFRNKVPMIPRDDFSPRSKFIYDVIYHGNKMVRKRYGSEQGLSRSHGGSEINGHLADDNLFRSASDSDINRRAEEREVGALSGENTDTLGNKATTESLQRGYIPGAYRRRKHRSKRSTSSLPALTSSEAAYSVRTKLPDLDYSETSSEVSRIDDTSRDVHSLDLAFPNKNFQLEHIWVVPSTEQIKKAIGRKQVNFRLEQSINEVDEFEDDRHNISGATEND